MKNQLKNRLQDLQSEYQKGQERLIALEQETATVKTSMLRISGAIQVLEEVLGTAKEGEVIQAPALKEKQRNSKDLQKNH